MTVDGNYNELKSILEGLAKGVINGSSKANYQSTKEEISVKSPTTYGLKEKNSKDWDKFR